MFPMKKVRKKKKRKVEEREGNGPTPALLFF